MTRYSLQRRPKGSRYSAIEDPAFRSKVVSLASSGASRRHVADLAGCPVGTLAGWVERGMAYPDVEPWGSFSADYRRAEAGIAGAAADIKAMTVQLMREQVAFYVQWRDSGLGGTPPPLPDVAALSWLDRTMEARFPSHYGASKHRAPDADFEGSNYLDAHVMEREQLGALFADPPEPIRLALVDSAQYVYAVLLAGGFDPTAQRKAEDGAEEEAQEGEA